MFKNCFVARVAVEKSRNVELFCNFVDPQSVTDSGSSLPPAQALGGFCFPLGPDNVKPKEYMAPEAPEVPRCRSVTLLSVSCVQKAVIPGHSILSDSS